MGDFTGFWLEATGLDLERIGSRKVDLAAEPPRYKSYPEAEVISLPPPGGVGVAPADLWQALHGRRSVRRYENTPLTINELSALLWACQGVTARQSHYLLRTAPSAGALYPFETYVFVNDVTGLPKCLAHFDLVNFRLEVVAREDLAPGLVKAALNQRFLAAAPVVFAFTTVPERAVWKYGDRASRYIGLDIGHLCQNLCLAAVGLGLGSCAVGAFLDGAVNALMGLDGATESIFYLCPVGKPA